MPADKFGGKKLKFLIFFTAIGFGSSALASCPAVRDQSARFDELVASINAAESPAQAQEFSQAMWDIWKTAPDALAQAMLDRGLGALYSYDFASAVTEFDALIAYCPDYAEGYNQRAFAFFLQADYARAIEDLERALERSPQHVAAMAGMALTLTRLGRTEAAQSILRDALDLNPWLSERSLLIEPEGEDI